MPRRRPLPLAGSPTASEFPLAYIVLAHNEWSTLSDLVGQLAAAPEDTVIVHLDRKVDQRRVRAFAEHVRNRPNVIVFSEVRCKWGGISLIDVTLRSLERLKASGRDYKYVSLLSGIDYPIKPLAKFRRYLSQNRDREYIEAYSYYTQRWIKTGIYAERFEYYFPFARSGILSKPFQVWYRFVEALDLRRPITAGFVPYSGSQWWTLSRPFIEWLIASSLTGVLLKRFEATFVPDEMFFQTMIMSSPFAERVTYRNLRHIEWLSSGTPHTFKNGDFDRLERSPQFFCRKIVKRYDPELVRRITNDLLSGRRPRRRPQLAQSAASQDHSR